MNLRPLALGFFLFLPTLAIPLDQAAPTPPPLHAATASTDLCEVAAGR